MFRLVRKCSNIVPIYTKPSRYIRFGGRISRGASDIILYEPELITRKDCDNSRGFVLLNFGENSCSYCNMMVIPFLEWMRANPYAKHFPILDGKNRPLGRSYRVQLWPTLILLKDGVEVQRLVRPSKIEDLDVISAAMNL